MSSRLRQAAGPQSDAGLARLLEEYLAAVEAGTAPPQEELLARHPHLAGELRECLASLAFIQAAVRGPLALDDGAASAPAQALGRLGDFRIVREVGRGGMGVVYEAEQVSLGRRVALKVLPFAAAIDDRHLQRFRTEAQAAAHLHHANIVPVFAVGSDRGVHYYAMQFIDGQTLADMIRVLRDPGDPPTGSSVTAAHDPTPLPTALVSGERRPRSGVTAALPPVGPAYYKALARLGVQAA